jgi:hypothetical protein
MRAKKMFANSPLLLMLAAFWFLIIGNVIVITLLFHVNGTIRFSNDALRAIIGWTVVMVPSFVFAIRSFMLELSYLRTAKKQHRKAHFTLLITSGVFILFLVLYGIGLPLLWWSNGSLANGD